MGMVKKRSTSRRYVTNVDLQQIVADNHADAVERLGRIEASLDGFKTAITPLTQKVETLERHRNYLTGAWAVVSLLLTTAIGFLFKGHH
jgi:hypothetical protein